MRFTLYRMSEISKIYSQYQESLKESQTEYNERLEKFSDELKKRYDEYIKNNVISYSEDFSNQIKRIEIKEIAERFFQTSEINFAAVDASCHKEESSNFISFYGGAYGSKGTITLSSGEGKIKYSKWELNKDVSMVAFIPIPPEAMHDYTEDINLESMPMYSDSEISQISSLHTKIMQLSEIFLGYSLTTSSTDFPRFILLDNSIGGILGNTSFAPNETNKLLEADFNGERITLADMHIALAHPFNKELNIPSNKKFQPHFRLIAEATWRETNILKESELGFRYFKEGAEFLSRREINAGIYDNVNGIFKFTTDPRASWEKSKRIFRDICEKLFREKNPKGVCFKKINSNNYEYYSPRDIVFFTGVGLRALIEECWKRKILLVGIVKDSSSRFWYRNYLGTLNVKEGRDQIEHLKIPLSDRSIVELLPNIDLDLLAPWSTIEFDSIFMTLHPEYENNQWHIKGYNTARGVPVTRPERIFLRSLAQFYVSEDKNLSSHALFVDRLAYPGWDNRYSNDLVIDETPFGRISSLKFDKEHPSHLQTLMMYLMGVLVRNHFPEALGYPDPLHQADWGAKSLKRRVLGLLSSSEWAFKSNPLSKTFRKIRDKFRKK